MKKITDFRLIEKKEWAKSTFLLLQCDEPLEEIKAGQFVQVRVDDAQHTYLRRPISIHDVDYQNRTITLLVQRVGEGTNKMSDTEIGDTLNIIYPLGNGFTIPENNEGNVILVGGGIGIAPLYYLGKMLKEKGIEPQFLLGGRSKSDLIMLEEFESVGKVYITTNDGSLGEAGFVTQHSIWKEKQFDMIYTCGPKPMMMAVTKIARENNIDCEVSLENLMACGLGACLCCVENTIEGNVCVCKEGPVMNINKLLW
ncbi:MAG: dihydroorotate dehydrogenase electron transfer subunit [Lentimicrobiaceae bacterium]|nr:dihydroorotate dehydrogenase electron transfer subunit [Lentimicrobiaceae bacterium]